jgi:hypothetical protein
MKDADRRELVRAAKAVGLGVVLGLLLALAPRRSPT